MFHQPGDLYHSPPQSFFEVKLYNEYASYLPKDAKAGFNVIHVIL